MHTATHPATVAPVDVNLELTLRGIGHVLELIHPIVGAKSPDHVLRIGYNLRVFFGSLSVTGRTLLGKARLRCLNLLLGSLNARFERQLEGQPFLGILQVLNGLLRPLRTGSALDRLRIEQRLLFGDKFVYNGSLVHRLRRWRCFRFTCGAFAELCFDFTGEVGGILLQLTISRGIPPPFASKVAVHVSFRCQRFFAHRLVSEQLTGEKFFRRCSFFVRCEHRFRLLSGSLWALNCHFFIREEIYFGPGIFFRYRKRALGRLNAGRLGKFNRRKLGFHEGIVVAQLLFRRERVNVHTRNSAGHSLCSKGGTTLLRRARDVGVRNWRKLRLELSNLLVHLGDSGCV